MFVIQSINCRRVLNSHVQFTNEFILRLQDGSTGIGASSQGETISMYEDKKVTIDPQDILQAISRDGLLGTPIDLASFDQYLEERFSIIGRNNAYGLSEAFFNAASQVFPPAELLGASPEKLIPPRLCLNILNGGWHAYTNPVLSDFSEFMLVARSNDIQGVIGEHNEIQRVVKEKQNSQSKVIVSGNPVNSFSARDNRAAIEFLLEIVDGLGLVGKYDLMIDASAGDLWDGSAYHLGITDGRTYSSEEFYEFWLDLIRNYRLHFLEDPFREQDFDSWQRLTTTQDDCMIIGDNLYSSGSERIADGAARKYAHAVVIKPNQAGTVSAVCRAIKTAQTTGHIPITSHRSISTESTFLSTITCLFSAPYIKIGPLLTDYSSIVRLNGIIRLTEGNYGD